MTVPVPSQTPDSQRYGALERHPRFHEASTEYEGWLAALLPTDRGGPGQRNWRVRCVGKACELLYAKTGRATGAAVLKIIGFGSSTDVSSDVRDWIENAAPRREALLELSPLLASEALRDAVNQALVQILTSAQQEARAAAQQELQGQREQLDHDRVQAAMEVARAGAAREAALQAAAAFETERDQHALARQQAEERAVKLQATLDGAELSLHQSADRQRQLQTQIERVQAETLESIARLEDISARHANEVARLDGDRRQLLVQVEEARQETRHLREDLKIRVTEVHALTQRNELLYEQATRSGMAAAAAQARVAELERLDVAHRDSIRRLEAALSEAQEDLAREVSLRSARQRMTDAVVAEAQGCAAIGRVLNDPDAVLIVDGDVLPRMQIQVKAVPVTPRFDSVKELEAHCLGLAATREPESPRRRPK
jgi:hypothetical protein